METLYYWENSKRHGDPLFLGKFKETWRPFENSYLESVPIQFHQNLKQCWHRGRPRVQCSRAHQQALATGPFGNTCEVDAVSPKAAMRGLQDSDVYNQGNIKCIYYNNNTSYIYHSTS
jgi:hypothetical protein